MTMSKPSEIDVMKTIDEQLTALEDAAARQRILRWATDKFFGGPGVPLAPVTNLGTPVGALNNTATTAKRPFKPAKNAPASSLVLVKDLNLKPSGKRSFKDFAAAKTPGSNYEKCLVAVYYLKNELGLAKVGVNHVYTCFKVEGWRVPSDLVNTLQWAASQEGWFDTKDREDIKLTTHGENHLEHDMPRKLAASGKN